MNKEDYKAHWEKVFDNKGRKDVSWYQDRPDTSISLFESCQMGLEKAIIDIGCGDSEMVDYWMNSGFKDVHALDVSKAAIERLKSRIGEYERIKYHVTNILEFKPDNEFYFWNDRAVFHFLTDENEIKSYVNLVKANLSKGAYLSLATFSKNGPLKCSGIPISQYNTEDLQSLFEPEFKLVDSFYEDHPTPFDSMQNFCFALFEKA
jgi:cyclopropane fatty-acyl-phospholipid synthase-like methyltransferase